MTAVDELRRHFYEALRANGHRLTTARRAIVAALVTHDGHLSADELATAVRAAAPGTGRMTVYRTLDLLAELGLIRPVYLGTGAARYILLPDGRHHHLVCSRCDAVVEFDECALDGLNAHFGRRFQFEVQGHLLELYGLCVNCQG